LPIALDTLLSRAAGTNKSKFIRTAIQHYICTVAEDAETFAREMKPA
jgi:metal-responsive CopG/Arc/MetJ family transcriptional regulator